MLLTARFLAPRMSCVAGVELAVAPAVRPDISNVAPALVTNCALPPVLLSKKTLPAVVVTTALPAVV